MATTDTLATAEQIPQFVSRPFSAVAEHKRRHWVAAANRTDPALDKIRDMDRGSQRMAQLFNGTSPGKGNYPILH